ncbi:hypothetical protein GS399_05405 [Pedobacter sp. HMF7647]|uniref:Fibronectin type III domain-containing protein n=1 Tax=Hufsiella arboris TaxID=2695275 RepID=A0A7K1Y750_9SPHI|nr:hypothetical protein [Hufsiella arboris]MXV50402.1 hypothetical protein [Hufsiella arboris]
MKKFVWMIFLSFLMVSCKEFIEPSISGRKVGLLAPADSTVSGTYNQTFWWNQVEDALNYRLQIVAPSFDKVSRLVMDTVVSSNKFSFTLEPGIYQWRVRAENGSSKTGYSAASLTVFSSAISNQQVQLRSPQDGFLTNAASQIFQWDKMYGASRYRFQLDTNNFKDENNLVADEKVSGPESSFLFTKDGHYQWRVRAESDTAQSKWSTVYKIGFDNTSPQLVSLLNPADKAVVGKPAKLSWEVIADAKSYELYVYKSDSVSLYSATFPVIQSGTSYSFTEGASGETVFWKVRAVDAVGNKGVFSPLRSFSIQ